MINVAVAEGKNRRTLAQKVMRQLEGELKQKLAGKKSIFLKPNLIHHEIGLAVTHVDTVRGVLDVLRDLTDAPITIGDAGFTGTLAAFRNHGYENLPSEYENITLMDLNDDDWVLGHSVRSDGSQNEVRRSKTALESDFKISVAPMKLHDHAGVSLSIESWVFGTWLVPPRIGPMGQVWARWPWLEEQGLPAMHASIAELYHQSPIDLSIVDGVQAMQNKGPVDGEVLELDAMIASTSPLAADAVAASIMGIDPAAIGYLAKISESGHKTLDLSEMNIPPAMIADLRRTVLTPSDFAEKLRLSTK